MWLLFYKQESKNNIILKKGSLPEEEREPFFNNVATLTQSEVTLNGW
ncbi:MAG: hypothetical protein WD469_14890 [Paenibacillaceae bacterium]